MYLVTVKFIVYPCDPVNELLVLYYLKVGYIVLQRKKFNVTSDTKTSVLKRVGCTFRFYTQRVYVCLIPGSRGLES